VDIAFLLLIVPGLAARAWWGMRRLRSAPEAESPSLRRRLWAGAILTQWGLVIALAGWWAHQHRAFASLGLVPRVGWGFAGVALGIALAAAMAVAQRRQVANDTGLRDRLRRRLAGVERLMPASRAEWPGFASLAITAGVCEEILFRGFVTWMLFHWLAGPWAAIAAQGALFGLAHAYQGPRGVFATGAVGIFLGAIAWLTGSLWAPMVLHALMDLHAGDLSLRVREPDAPSAPAPA